MENTNKNSELGCCWHFAPQEGGREEGPNNAMMQNFRARPYSSLLREIWRVCLSKRLLDVKDFFDSRILGLVMGAFVLIFGGFYSSAQIPEPDNRSPEIVLFHHNLYVIDNVVRIVDAPRMTPAQIEAEKRRARKSKLPVVIYPGYEIVNGGIYPEWYSWRLNLPKLQFSNPRIMDRINNMNEEEGYLSGHGGLYIALHPDSLIVLGCDLQSIWTATGGLSELLIRANMNIPILSVI